MDTARVQQAADIELSHAELLRYARHLSLPEVGPDGQLRLKAARVLLVGAGGLGSPAALYLAAAGVGTIGLVDFDVVDETNLQRQVLYGSSDIGTPKLAAAAARLADTNPHVHIDTFETKLTSDNALDIVRQFDVVVDGSDNFPTRYLVNDACVLTGRPNVYGAIFRFEGQASVFATRDGPCYRCLFREPPPPGLVPSCAEAGVLGVLPGIIGSIQALEAIKLVLNRGETLSGRLVLFDAAEMRFRELKLQRDPECPVCGNHPTLHTLIDYEAFCGMGGQPSANSMEINPPELADERESNPRLTIVDVREPYEWQISRIAGSVHIPLGSLPRHMGELEGGSDIVTVCHHGVRSMLALELLRAAGFSRVRSLRGGIDAWAKEIDRSVALY
jgi:adenylyltransferase/sulfurtransferase